MVKQKKRSRITQSGKNCAINCTIMGARLIWKQTIWLLLIRPYCWLANHNAEFRCVICTVLHYLHWCYTFFALVLHILHSFLSQSESSNFIMYIISFVIAFWFLLFYLLVIESCFLFCRVNLLGFGMRQNHCSPQIALANCGPVLILLCICKLVINLNLHELEITESKSSVCHPQKSGSSWEVAPNIEWNVLLWDWNRLGWLHSFAAVCSSPENRSKNLSDTVLLRLCLDTLWGGLLALLSSTSESIRLLEYVPHSRIGFIELVY